MLQAVKQSQQEQVPPASEPIRAGSDSGSAVSYGGLAADHRPQPVQVAGRRLTDLHLPASALARWAGHLPYLSLASSQ